MLYALERTRREQLRGAWPKKCVLMALTSHSFHVGQERFPAAFRGFLMPVTGKFYVKLLAFEDILLKSISGLGSFLAGRVHYSGRQPPHVAQARQASHIPVLRECVLPNRSCRRRLMGSTVSASLATLFPVVVLGFYFRRALFLSTCCSYTNHHILFISRLCGASNPAFVPCCESPCKTFSFSNQAPSFCNASCFSFQPRTLFYRWRRLFLLFFQSNTCLWYSYF